MIDSPMTTTARCCSTSTLALLCLTAITPAQGRILIGGVPSNLSLDLSSTAVVLDPTAPNAFYALTPISPSLSFASFEADWTMNILYGSGTWLHCTMIATHWAYLSSDACAHQPALGAMATWSLLTTDYDWGIYGAVPGTPNQPWPGATAFSAGTYPAASFCGGLSTGWTPAHWQLRTSSFFYQQWNACPNPGPQITPTFNGWLVARFTFVFA